MLSGSYMAWGVLKLQRLKAGALPSQQHCHLTVKDLDTYYCWERGENILFQCLFIKMQCCSTLFYSLPGDSAPFPCPYTFKFLQAQMFISLGTTSHTDKKIV